MSKPVIVLVHGSWHSPEHYKPTTTLLEKEGYVVEYALHPTTHAEHDRASKDMSHDVDAVRSVLESQLDAGKDVVLFVHSYAALIGLAACGGLDSQSRGAAGKRGSIISIVDIAGPVAPVGITSKQMFNGKLPAPCTVEDGLSLPEDPIGLLYADLPKEDGERYASMLKPQSVAIHDFPCPDIFTPAKNIPLYYLVCKNDHTTPNEAFQKFIGAFKQAGFQVQAAEIDAGHSPFISNPEQTAMFVRKAAGEDVESGLAVFEV